MNIQYDCKLHACRQECSLLVRDGSHLIILSLLVPQIILGPWMFVLNKFSSVAVKPLAREAGS